MSETTAEVAAPADNLPEITLQIENVSATKKKINAEIPAERIAAKLKAAYGELKNDAVLPGFRRGRAPQRLLEKRFGGDLKNTVKGQLVAEAYEKAVTDNKIDAIGEPEVDMAKIELPASGPLSITIQIEVTPEFTLPSLEGIEVKKPILAANQDRLNLAIENLRRHFGHWQDSRQAATSDDVVLADVKVQDQENNILTEQPSVQLAVKPGSIMGVKFDDLGDKLTGAVPGATITLEATVPEDHAQESLRGKKLTVTLDVKSVKHMHLPEVNQEFAQMLGFDTVDELNKDLTDRLVVQLEQETKGAMAQQIYRHLLSNTQLELPANTSQRQMLNVLRRRATEMMQRGVAEADIAQHIDELRISSAQQAAADLKLFFIMSKLAKQFELDVSDSEVNGRIAAIATQYGRRPEKLRTQFEQQGQLEQLFLQIRDGKVVDKLLETAKVTEVDEKTLAEEFKNQPPLSGVGPNVQGISATNAT